MIGGGVATALVVIVGGIMMSGGDKTETLAETPAQVTNNGAAAETPTASTDRYYTAAIFEIYRAKSEDAYENFRRKEATLDDLAGQLSEVSGTIAIELLDSAGNVLASAPTWTAGDLIEIPAERKVGTMIYRVVITDPAKPGSEGESYTDEIEAATAPDATANVPIIFGPVSTL